MGRPTPGRAVSWLTAALLAAVAVLRTGAAVLRIRRVGCAGVSGAGVVAWVAVNAAWVAYAARAGLLGALPSEVCYLAGSVALLVGVHRAGAVTTRAWCWGAGVASAYAGVGAGAAGSSPGVLGLALTLSVLLYGTPALVAGLRAPSVTGLSAAALTVTLCDALACVAYGASAGGAVYVVYGVAQVALTAPVLVRVVAARRQPRRRRAGLVLVGA